MSDGPDTLRLIEALQHVAWARDLRSGRLTYLSPTVRGFLGLDDGDAEAGWPALIAAVHPDDAPLFAHTPGGPEERSFEFRYQRRGEARWASAALRVDSAAGRLDGVIVDVTQRAQAAREAAALRRRADALRAVAHDVSALLEVPAIARAVCEHVRRVFGEYVRATFMLYEASAASFVVVHHEGDPPGSNEQPARYRPRPWPMPGPHREQQIIYVRDRARDYEPDEFTDTATNAGAQSYAFAFLISGEAVVGALALATFDRELALDADDLDLLRAMADQAAGAVHNAGVLTESRLNAQSYRNILDAVFDGINITDFDGVIRYCNAQFAAMVGSTPEGVVGKSTRDLVFPEDMAIAEERIRRRRAGFSVPFNWRLRALDDGREVLVRANSREIKDEHGKPAAMLGVISDITSARRLEEKLLQSQKLESLGVLAGGIAHDFNNLLVGVLGNAGMALSELPATSPLRPLLEDMQAAALRAADLTRQLLSYSGKGRFVLSTIDLGRVVEEMSQLLAAGIAKGITLRYQLGEALPPIEGDATQIRQVLMSLITNASDAIDDGGAVTISTSLVHADGDLLADTFVDDNLASGDYLCLEVSDTGQGMSPETVARIFDPFYTTKFVGRGLGLAAVLGILRGHKGAIKVLSEPGRGTAVRAYFPAAAVIAEAPPAPAPAPVRRDGLILVVDDEEGVRLVARRIFERWGYRVLVAKDGVEGVDCFRERAAEVSAVLLDVTMPRMGGEEAFLALRRIRPDVRVLFMSGYSEQEALGRFGPKGLASFIEKPFRPQALIDKLQALLGG